MQATCCPFYRFWSSTFLSKPSQGQQLFVIVFEMIILQYEKPEIFFLKARPKVAAGVETFQNYFALSGIIEQIDSVTSTVR